MKARRDAAAAERCAGWRSSDSSRATSAAGRATAFWSSPAPATPAGRLRDHAAGRRRAGWRALNAAAWPLRPGARDTLRLEAGMNLYGSDMDETVAPLDPVSLDGRLGPADRDFIGRGALEQKARAGTCAQVRRPAARGSRRAAQPPEGGRRRRRRGRGHQRHVLADARARSIALRARAARPDRRPRCEVEIRGKPLRARVVRPPFVRRNGRRLIAPWERPSELEVSMSNVPCRPATKSHEWVRSLPDGSVEIGITDHAQQALGDLVFAEVPEAGRRVGAPARPARSSSRSRPPPTSTARSRRGGRAAQRRARRRARN